MAISILPIKDFQAINPLTPSPTLISQLAQTELANTPDTSVFVTLGDGEPAILIYDSHGILQQALFDLAPPPSAANEFGAQLSASIQASLETTLAEQSSIAAASATLDTTSALFNPTVNLTQAAVANDVLFTLTETSVETAAAIAHGQTPKTGTPDATIAKGIIAATAANIANPALTSLQAANQELVNAPSSTTAATNTESEQALAGNPAINPAFPATTPTTTELATDVDVTTTALNITPAHAVQSAATATQQALNIGARTTETTQSFSTIPTTDVTNNLLQSLLTQAANQALANISSNPSYANSLAALILSSGVARVRMVDETGALLNTPEPVGPIRPIAPGKALV